MRRERARVDNYGDSRDSIFRLSEVRNDVSNSVVVSPYVVGWAYDGLRF
jgi:hypothetical protein